MDVVLVVDTSGSMAWDIEGRKKSDPKFQAPPRIDRVVKALREYAKKLAKLPDGASVRLVSFNSGVKTDKEFIVSPGNSSELEAVIEGLKQQVGVGNTHLPEALERGLQHADAYASKDPDVTPTLYVLTDGELDYGDPKKNAARQNFLSEALATSPYAGTDRLYASLVMLGKLESDGGSFSKSYFESLQRQGGKKCEVQLDDDFNPLFPPMLTIRPEKPIPGQNVSVLDASGQAFEEVKWSVDDEITKTDPVLDFTPPAFGRYNITFEGKDKKGRRARARTVLTVGQTPVKALPEIYIDGKPLKTAGRVIQGQMMRLTHNSEGPVRKLIWRVNSEEVSDQKTFTKELAEAGEYEVSLTVEAEPDLTGAAATDTATESFKVFQPALEARPEISSVDGKPYAEAGAVHPGATITLVSQNTSFAKAFEWQAIGPKGTESLPNGQTVQWRVPYSGNFRIVHTVIGGAGGSQKNTGELEFSAVDAELNAVANVLYRGKPAKDSSNIYVGETLQLVSDSAGPVQSAVWTVNGEDIVGNSVSWPISQPGEIKIRLKVQGQNPDQTAEDVQTFTAKNRPPVWMLWALGLTELGILGFFAWLLTGNQVRDYRLVVANGPRPQIRKFFSRFSKTATIPFNKMLKTKDYWKKVPDRDALVISRQSAAKGPAAKLACTFAPARRGTSDVQFGESKAATNTERFYLLEDARNPDDVQTVEFTLQAGKKSYGDLFLLCSLATALVAVFFWFYLKIYPAF